jgi:hypothetical protein
MLNQALSEVKETCLVIDRDDSYGRVSIAMVL